MISREVLVRMGPPKATPSKQKNTLFSYFSKSPAPSNVGATNDTSNDILSPKKSPNRCSSKSNVSEKGNAKGILLFIMDHSMIDPVAEH